MAINVKSINCPQCGSTSVTMISSTRAKCDSCGSQFMVKDIAENQTIHNETHYHYDGNNNETLFIGSIKDQYSEEQFIRAAWIELAKQDAPLDVFKSDFGMVEHIGHEVVCEFATANVNYTARIGNDRQEPYIDYETYYEKETYYENGIQKCRDVPKQRQVTKYKTVTDWYPFSGNGTYSSTAVLDYNSKTKYNSNLFKKCILSAVRDRNSLGTIDNKRQERARKIVSAAWGSLYKMHLDSYYNNVMYDLPGDHKENISCSIGSYTSKSTYFLASNEYRALINYGGKDYAWYAFPFGHLQADGEIIKNEKSLKGEIQKKKDEIPGLVWDKIKTISIITIFALIASIIVSCLALNVLAVVLIFIAAVTLFIINCVREYNTKKEITETINKEIEDYTNIYRKKQLEVLNSKLSSLSLAKATAGELGWKLED